MGKIAHGYMGYKVVNVSADDVGDIHMPDTPPIRTLQLRVQIRALFRTREQCTREVIKCKI
jgi:hypothetical protein